MTPVGERIPILYLAPWVDVGGSDKGTIDWFRFLDRDRFQPSLITTQPSLNRRLGEVVAYAEEIWDLPALMPGNEFARFILTFIHTRRVKLVHIMNSRLAFELLPDISGLSPRPRVVVQLHVEEPDRSGYVRYVASRYGNLVDAFSVSSQDLSDRLGAYDVPAAKRRLIRTGVDAGQELAPRRIMPVALDPNCFHILFAARLTAQKDPLLMVEVARELRDRGLRFQLHVLGDGDLSLHVRDRITALGLGREVIMHGDHMGVAAWHAACDAVLLTSDWEGVPYVLYEAMAMATPVVAPALPGIRELVSADTGVLVSPRDDAWRYAAALEELAADPHRCKAMGAAARARALAKLSLEDMAAAHGSLYDELLGTAAPEASTGPWRWLPPPSPGLRNRRPGHAPLVSVIVPCFNHGRYLDSCLQSIADQTHPAIETIVVDDGSTDPETLAALAEIEANGGVTLVRMPGNRGPSAARNAAIAHVNGRYVLPLDADNLLLPAAVETLVEQISSAGEQIGFVYPNYRYFGNRNDRFEPPSYNLDALLESNYCDTSSLIDREVFDRGFRYAEDVVLGHEDWDFVLELAENGIYGEPARADTLLTRKRGFTRSDLVEAGSIPFAEVVAARHPRLFDPNLRAGLKGAWCPSVSVIALDPLAEKSDTAPGDLVVAALRQTCEDFEVVVRTENELWPTLLGRRLRRTPRASASSRAQALREALALARGRYALVTYGSPAALLGNRSLIEKALRVLQANPHLDALAFAESTCPHAPFSLLDSAGAAGAALGALFFTATGPKAPPAALELAGPQPLETLACWLSAHATLQMRHLPRPDSRAIASELSGSPAAIGEPRYARRRDARVRAGRQPELPRPPRDLSARVGAHAWTPPQSRLLCRHRDQRSQRYVISNDPAPGHGCVLEYHLGCVRALPFPGTEPLLVSLDGDGPELAPGAFPEIDCEELLGFVEQAPLPLFDPLWIGRHRETGQPVLAAGHEDPILAMLEDPKGIGYIEPYPIHPRRAPHVDAHYGLVGLVRTVDSAARRHRYGAGHVPAGRLAGELGALLAEPIENSDPLWIDAHGAVFTARASPHSGRPSASAAAAWAVEPLTWRRFSTPAPKLRATARRAYDSVRILASSHGPARSPARECAGHLLRSPNSRTLPLFAAIHPVTGDQLLSTAESEPLRLGYRDVALLGHLIADAPLTGRLGVIRPGVQWAHRFGL